jgi:hypothetical protein
MKNGLGSSWSLWNKEKNGHCNLSTRNGRWISHQRRLFTSKELKENQYEKLVMIGFTFEDRKFAIDNERWNRLFMELVEYKQKKVYVLLFLK